MRFVSAKACAAGALVLIASACSAQRALLPPANAPGVSENAGALRAPAGYGIVRFRIAVPGRTRDPHRHRLLPAYVSSATKKVAVTVRGANQSSSTAEKFGCAAVCSGKIVAPLGVDAVTIALEDKKGRVLSRGSTTVVVFKTKNNVFDFTLDGVPASVALVPESNLLPVVPASTGYFNFDARDADGRIVTPDGHYTDANGNPLVFTLKSSSHALKFSVDTVSAPGARIAYSYNGSLHVGTVTLVPRAGKGIHTTVAFHPATLRLVPGIAQRILPPLPVQLLAATQVPIPAGSAACGGFPCFDPNAIFLLGNAGEIGETLKFDVSDGAYGQATSTNLIGPFASPPVVYVEGFYGELYSNGGYGNVSDNGASYGSGTSSSSPCSGLVPIGRSSMSSTLYCLSSGIGGGVIYDVTHGTPVATGLDRKIQEINGTTYFATVATATPAPTQQVYASGSTTPVSGAISVGADPTDPTAAYYGDFDGTVKRGTTTVAAFSHPVENVLGNGTTIYAYESNGAFGVSGSSGTFESRVLPIGTVLELVSGLGGKPMLVETNGTLDVMGI